MALSGQPNTEVYLLDIKEGNKLVNLRNISNNEGYDNQPSFYDDNTILFASTRNKQTDIRKYDIKTGTTSWITNSDIGSEYSPLKIPNQEAISAIRLDTNGLQRLYRIDIKNGNSTELLKDLKVGYHVWYSEDILVATVLVDDRMDLVVANLKENTNDTIQQNVGRSLHKIPNSDLISFISKEKWGVKSLDPITGVSKEIIPLSKDTKDICWLNDGTILMPVGKSILKGNLETDKNWHVLHTFEEKEINEISRMSVSANGKYLAIVSEVSPAIIVQKQLETFNKANLKEFAACFSDNIIVKNFHKDTMYIGNDKLQSNYQNFFDKHQNTKVTVLQRIVMRNKVIDEESVMIDGKKYHQVAIYEVENGKITSMTFINPKKGDPVESEKIVENQLMDYNQRDLDKFVANFADDIKSYSYPKNPAFEGQEILRTIFLNYFEKTPDLNCEIKKRIVIKNIVIDEEYITANGGNFSAVAIYEIKDGKIAAMTFIQ